MAVAYRKNTGTQKKSNKTIKLPKDLVAELDALPNGIKHNVVWTPQMDQILMQYWEKKNKSAVAKVIGVCYEVCRQRWIQIGGEQ